MTACSHCERQARAVVMAVLGDRNVRVDLAGEIVMQVEDGVEAEVESRRVGEKTVRFAALVWDIDAGAGVDGKTDETTRAAVAVNIAVAVDIAAFVVVVVVVVATVVVAAGVTVGDIVAVD